MDEFTHTIEIAVSGNYAEGPMLHFRISLNGDGGPEHLFDAFKLAVIAAGFGADVVKKIEEIDV